MYVYFYVKKNRLVGRDAKSSSQMFVARLKLRASSSLPLYAKKAAPCRRRRIREAAPCGASRRAA